MSNWQWHDWNGLSYLTCSLLADWSHGFFTRDFWPRSPEQLVNVLRHQVNPLFPEVFRVKQVHGNTVLPTSQLTPITQNQSEDLESSSTETTVSLSLEEADGLRTEKADQAVWVASADCSPVLIADIVTGQVAAVHSGWRGTAKAIVPEAIAQFIRQSQTHDSQNQLKNLRIAIGPAIAGEVYQVSEAVAAEVGMSIHSENISPEALTEPQTLTYILEWLQQIPGSPIFPDREPGKVRLDVRQAINLQLEKIGINPEQIATAKYCTYQTPEQFFSYRRDGLKKVQWSGIISQ
ncbi:MULTISPECIES: peptidoglycan editing factor PgeF [Planktothricoides]|uniref:Purine nucleoside phosphorylase n=2 Tax=Planktothricoides raciborskii TaxID=132608 RepID=A0AAU8JDQ4_9CYAN|nr:MULTISPECIES: peptidoglycan editing factor PgeF [Planktothricoides]KOR33892.1 laccase [Planktothricoides sp. SR001]MBD2547697.1 peptidoglycan editing factor PgeF [Planktothricoides raciborskii FACHB-1370]MBD2586102.1 peptidoglycan editing factor PgeF [Planktothricoides raciborskii FACHB-1261]